MVPSAADQDIPKCLNCTDNMRSFIYHHTICKGSMCCVRYL